MTQPPTRTTTLTTASILAAAAAIPEGMPFVMLNMLRYKEQATYGPGYRHESDDSETFYAIPVVSDP